jgi:hypothetical protein
MAVTLVDGALGYDVAGPEADQGRDARVDVEKRGGKLRFYVSTVSSWMSPDRATAMAAQITECVEAIDELVATVDPDLLDESHHDQVSAPHAPGF